MPADDKPKPVRVFKMGDPSFGIIQWQFPDGFVEKVPPHLRNDMAKAVVLFFQALVRTFDDPTPADKLVDLHGKLAKPN